MNDQGSSNAKQKSWFRRHKLISAFLILTAFGLVTMVVESFRSAIQEVGEAPPPLQVAPGTSKRAAQSPSVTQEPVVTPQKKVASFDVPSLIGRSLSEIETALGTPSYNATPPPAALAAGLDTWERSWEKESHSLTASYNPYTFQIVEFFVSLGGDSTTDTDRFLEIGNLAKNDPKYNLEFVSCRNCDTPNSYTGVIVKPR